MWRYICVIFPEMFRQACQGCVESCVETYFLDSNCSRLLAYTICSAV